MTVACLFVDDSLVIFKHVLMFDARVGVTSDLLETAQWLRTISIQDETHPRPGCGRARHISRLANKLEGSHWWDDQDSPVVEHLTEAMRLGFGADLAVTIQDLTAARVKRSV
jgi:hypothetical protein